MHVSMPLKIAEQITSNYIKRIKHFTSLQKECIKLIKKVNQMQPTHSKLHIECTELIRIVTLNELKISKTRHSMIFKLNRIVSRTPIYFLH